MIETYYDTLEEEFALRADNIFRYEENLWHERDGDYTKEERKAVLELSEMIKEFYWENHIKEKDLSPHPASDEEYIRGQHNYLMKLDKQAVKDENFPVSYFFIGREQVISYNICHEYTPDFADKDAFSLFLAFKLRHISRYKIHACLDYYQELIGEEFLSFYNYSFDEYKYLFDEQKIKVITDWLKAKKSIPEQNQNSTMKSSEQEETYNDSELTLLLYFFLKQMGVDPKLHKSEMVKFLHILRQKNYTGYNNSNFKRKVVNAPSVAKEKATIDYLKKVGAIFKKYDLENIESLVDEVILKEINSKKEK